MLATHCCPGATRVIPSRYDLADRTAFHVTSTGETPSNGTLPPSAKSTPPIRALVGGCSRGVVVIAVPYSATCRLNTMVLEPEPPGGLTWRTRPYSTTE